MGVYDRYPKYRYPQMKLSDTACKAAKPSAKLKKLADGHGLYLAVMPNGAKYWRLKYRYLGKEKLLALGVYPETSLKEARDKREAARELLEADIDPAESKKERRREKLEKSEQTFERIAHEWHESQKSRWTPRHAAYIINRLENDIFPEIGRRPITDISSPQILAAVRKIENRGAHEIARRALQMCGQIFRYAIATGKAERNPTPDLKGALKQFKKGHYAALSSKDLPEFVAALERNEARLYPLTRHALKLMLLTFVRTSELIGAKWDEFNLEKAEWVIPAERMKMRKSHIVPLCHQAITILREVHKQTGKWPWVFPNMVRPQKPMSNNTLLKALERMGYKGRMTGHGFRALAMSTIKEELGYRHEVVDRQLAHAPKSKVDAAYDRAAFVNERKKMMQDWADYLEGNS